MESGDTYISDSEYYSLCFTRSAFTYTPKSVVKLKFYVSNMQEFCAIPLHKFLSMLKDDFKYVMPTWGKVLTHFKSSPVSGNTN